MMSRAHHGVAEAEGKLLAGEAGGARTHGLVAQHLQHLRLAALVQRVLELVLPVEMVLDDALVAAGDEDDVLDPGGARLVDHVLHDGPVDDGEHFLRHGLGGRQEARAEAGHGKDRFANGFYHGGFMPLF